MLDEIRMTANPSQFDEEKVPKIETLTEIMKTANCVLSDALHMAYSINHYLLGIGAPVAEEHVEPKCYRDDLTFHAKKLGMLAEELSKIMKGLGIE